MAVSSGARYSYTGLVLPTSTSQTLLIPEGQQLTITLDCKTLGSGAGYLTISHDSVQNIVNSIAGISWAANTNYAQGTIVQPDTPNTFYYFAQTAGVSGATQPTFPATVGNTVVDGGVTWINIGTAIPANTVAFPQWTPGPQTATIAYQSFPADATITAVRCVNTGSVTARWLVTGDRFCPGQVVTSGGASFAEVLYLKGYFRTNFGASPLLAGSVLNTYQ